MRLAVTDIPWPGIGAFTVDIAYDPNIVDSVSCATDPARVMTLALCNPNFQRDDIDSDIIRVVGFQTHPGAVVGTAALADSTFHVLATGYSGLIITVQELADTSAANIPYVVTSGRWRRRAAPGSRRRRCIR